MKMGFWKHLGGSSFHPGKPKTRLFCLNCAIPLPHTTAVSFIYGHHLTSWRKFSQHGPERTALAILGDMLVACFFGQALSDFQVAVLCLML